MTTALLDRPKISIPLEVEIEDGPSIHSLLRRLPELPLPLDSPIEDGSRKVKFPEYVIDLMRARSEADEGWSLPNTLDELLEDLGLPNGEFCERCGLLVVIGEWPLCHGDSNEHGRVVKCNAKAASIVYYEGRNGELRFGDYRDMGIEPKRFQRHEIRSMSEAREFERRVNQKEYDKYDRSIIKEQMTFEPAMKEHSSEARRVIKTEQGKEMQRQAQKLVAEKSRKPNVTKKDIGFQTAYSR